MDARAVDERFRTPPAMQMTSPEGHSRLEAGNILTGCMWPVVTLTLVSVAYGYLVSSRRFALEPVFAGELGLSHLEGVLLERNTIISPRCATLPMGFSWSAYLAQSACEETQRKAAGQENW